MCYLLGGPRCFVPKPHQYYSICKSRITKIKMNTRGMRITGMFTISDHNNTTINVDLGSNLNIIASTTSSSSSASSYHQQQQPQPQPHQPQPHHHHHHHHHHHCQQQQHDLRLQRQPAFRPLSFSSSGASSFSCPPPPPPPDPRCTRPVLILRIISVCAVLLASTLERVSAVDGGW